MMNRRFRSPMKVSLALLSFGFLLAFGQVAVPGALAAEPAPGAVASPAANTMLAADAPAGSSTWETWPRKPEGVPAAGEAGGSKTSSGISAGTWGWIAGGTAAVILIGVAASGSGSGTTATPVHVP